MKTVKSPYLCNILTDFHEIRHSDAFSYPAPDLQFEFVIFDNLIMAILCGSSRQDMLAVISSRYQYGPFLLFVAEVMSNYLTTDGLKKFSILPEAPLRPEARGICHICHMVNPALLLFARWGR